METKRPRSWCRHCGAFAVMSYEHLPPRATGNDSLITRLSAPGEDRHELLDISEWAEGHALPTVCRPCNGKAARWGYPNEYTRWHEGVVALMRNQVSRRPGHDPFEQGSVYEAELAYDVMPRRFIGHVVSMILAAQWSEHLWAENPQLVRLIGGHLGHDEEPPGPVDITPWRVHLGLVNQNYLVQRRVALQLRRGDPEPRTSSGIHLPARPTMVTPFYLFVYSPFMVTLMHHSSIPSWPATDVTSWAGLGHHERLPKALRYVGLRVCSTPIEQLIGAGPPEPLPASY